ncbi:MAG TPA: sigma-70 family RNA polymerase sigma factor [Verrucomicrobiae bacterium]|nr:sigma-70 family RNA polymerase sigma factor [Verrucomicrobiae bacterium]
MSQALHRHYPHQRFSNTFADNPHLKGSLDLLRIQSSTRQMTFPKTHWTALARATLHGETQARAALEELCGSYWNPVYQFIRWRGMAHAEAQDLTQEFMLHVMQKSIFSHADRLQGQFRSFLLGALVRFMADAADKRNALKRGGKRAHVSLDKAEPLASLDRSSLAFDREWALTALETALQTLRTAFAETGRESDFGILKTFLPGSSGASSYETAAAQLAMSVPALKSEVHRLRHRFRELVREQIARTVSAPHEIEAEIQHLEAVLRDKGTDFAPDAKLNPKTS